MAGENYAFPSTFPIWFFLFLCAKYKSKNTSHYGTSKIQSNNFFQNLDQKTYRLQFDTKIQI